MKRWPWGALALVLAACGSDSKGGGATGTDATAADGATGGDATHAADAAPGDAASMDSAPTDAAPADALPPDAAPPLLAADCDPIGVHCGFPFPSDVYTAPAATPTGKVLRFGADTLPKAHGTTPFPNEVFADFDGWSVASAPMTYMPGATATGLATPATIASTTTPDSPTILLNAATGELVPHWVNLDASVRNQDQKTLILRPAVLLDNSTRYIVAIRHVVDADGHDVPPTAVFQALRDGTDDPDPSVASRREHYADLFAKLEAAGIHKDGLQIAWDFTTGSKESITGPMLKVRDAALAIVGADGPEFTVKSVEDNPNDQIKTRVILTARVPAFLTTTAYMIGDPAPKLLWDAQGHPMQNGWRDMDVLVQIPKVVDEPGRKLGVIQNGHGLFGDKEEGRNGYLAKAAAYGYVTIAVDYYGFSENDTGLAVEGLSGRIELLRAFVERQVQGMVDQLLAMRMMIGRVARDGIRTADGQVLLAGGVIDPNVRFYRGDSQGGIMGGTYMAISTDVTRGLLGEPGCAYSLLLNRSNDWPEYGSILAGTFADDRDVQLILGVLQVLWDRTEPSGFVKHLHGDLPGSPDHQVLLHDAPGDHQVYTGAAHIVARAVGAKLLRSNDPAHPVVRDVFGLDAADAPLQNASAIVEYDFALPPEPLDNLPSLQGCDPHDRVRVLGPSLDQQDHFFRTGEIAWYCDGLCNCDGDHEEEGCRQSFHDECE
jgi:hypothetical protein